MYKFLIAGAFVLTSFYTLQFTDTDGNTVSMNSYQNKKVLIVNIATESPRVAQLGQLQQLQQLYADSLVIIAFPSNSFGNEPRSNAEIKQFCQVNYGVTFKIGAKNPVAGAGLQSVYSWLATASENGSMSGVVTRDFQKFLIDREGKIIGSFSPTISPLDSIIQNAITGQ